jgi:hypothetical protein
MNNEEIDISHFVQAGFQTAVAILIQIREGRKGAVTDAELEDAASLLRRVSANLRLSGY